MNPSEDDRHLQPENSPEGNPQVCPYLATCDDPQVRYSFPERLNACYRVTRPQRVALDHQGEVCLAGANAYQACPVYSPEWTGPLPKELRGVEHHASRSREIGLWVGCLALIGLAVIFIYSHFVAAPGTPEMIATSTQALAVVDELTRSATPVATDTPAMVTFTPTPQPALLNSPTIVNPTSTIDISPTTGPLENTPFGPGGRYVVHKIKDGEMMEVIAKLYNTSPAVLKAVNGLRPEAGFWAGNMVVIAVGEANPDNVFPMQAVFLDKPALLAVLAEKYVTSIDELRAFNGLGPGDTVPGGRWIVTRKK